MTTTDGLTVADDLPIAFKADELCGLGIDVLALIVEADLFWLAYAEGYLTPHELALRGPQ